MRLSGDRSELPAVAERLDEVLRALAAPPPYLCRALGIVRYELGQHLEAAEACVRAQEIEPSRVGTVTAMACWRAAGKKAEGARWEDVAARMSRVATPDQEISDDSLERPFLAAWGVVAADAANEPAESLQEAQTAARLLEDRDADWQKQVVRCGCVLGYELRWGLGSNRSGRMVLAYLRALPLPTIAPPITLEELRQQAKK